LIRVQADFADSRRRGPAGETIAPDAPDLVNWLEYIEANRRIRCL